MNKILSIILFLLFVNVLNIFSVDRIYLNDGWQFRRVGDSIWYPVTVPGTVHTDLYNNGLIGDPFFRDNEKDLQWIENEDWEYRCEFELPDSVYEQSKIDLIFEGLDTYAKVYLNDSLIITADNMFTKWETDTKKFVQPGKNMLYILFESPIRKAKELKSGPELPGGDRVYTRKAAYQYGWDFGPRFVTSGIWKKVYIEGWSDAKIGGLIYFNRKISNDRVNLTAKFFNQYEFSGGDFEIRIIDGWTNEILASKIDEVRKLNIRNKWINRIPLDDSLTFVINHPKFWWCNGYGEPYLYNFKYQITLNDKILDERDVSYGIRSIELVQEKDSFGKSFYFKLNGEQIFIKGANYIPQDYFIPVVSKNKQDKLLSDVIKTNINMIRVWGGGIYPEDDFYKVCDEKGIMVWQDLMFANGMYPFKILDRNISNEINQLTEPTWNHCSISLFCGNNEIEEGWFNWGWQREFGYTLNDSLQIWNEYLDFYNSFNDYFPYIPTSPKIGWGHPEAMKEGDSHYWGVWWGMEPFEMYEKKIPRFMSEYGFQGFPDMKTIDSFTLTEDRYLYSPVMKAHQKHPTGYETIQTYMEREYKQPKDFESYVYDSQLLQAYGIKRAIEAQRRAKPYCMGTMYWQLNDCWPGVTWSGIDYYGRWKAMQYFVKDAYKDILVSVHEENDSVKVWIVNDRMDEVKGKLSIELIDLSGTPQPPFVKGGNDKTVIIPGNSSGIDFSFPRKDFKEVHSLNNVVLVVNFKDEQGEEYSNLYYFVPPKDLALEDPKISYDIDKQTGELNISCLKLAKNVYIQIDDTTAPLNLEKNYFDMLPGENVKINTGVKNLESSKIKIRSLFDTY